MLALQNDPWMLGLNIVTSICEEIFQRNNLWLEIFCRIVCRKPAGPQSKIYSIYLGIMSLTLCCFFFFFF